MSTPAGERVLQAELEALRGREAGASPEELKLIKKRKAEVKLMIKRGISPVVVPSMSMPSLGLPRSLSSGMDAAGAAVGGVIDTVNGGMSKEPWYPTFTPPTQDDLAEFGGAMSFGTLMGFCSGYALKKIGRAGATTVGVIFMSLTVAQRQVCSSRIFFARAWGSLR